MGDTPMGVHPARIIGVLTILAVLAGSGCLEFGRSLAASQPLTPGSRRRDGQLMPLEKGWMDDRYGLYVRLDEIAAGAAYVVSSDFPLTDSLYGLGRASDVAIGTPPEYSGAPALSSGATTIEGTDYYLGRYEIDFIVDPPPTTIIVYLDDQPIRLVDGRLLNVPTTHDRSP